MMYPALLNGENLFDFFFLYVKTKQKPYYLYVEAEGYGCSHWDRSQTDFYHLKAELSKTEN